MLLSGFYFIKNNKIIANILIFFFESFSYLNSINKAEDIIVENIANCIH